MTNMEVVRRSVLSRAGCIGMGIDLGSIEAGKLADLGELDVNTLDEIRNSESVRYVMINGRIFDATTMNEIGNHPREHMASYRERPGSDDAFVWQGGHWFRAQRLRLFG